MKKHLLLAALVSLGLVVPADADDVAYEGFVYTPGADDPNGAAGGVGWAGAWEAGGDTEFETPGLDFAGLNNCQGNRMIVGKAADTHRQISAAPLGTDGDLYWVGMLAAPAKTNKWTQYELHNGVGTPVVRIFAPNKSPKNFEIAAEQIDDPENPGELIWDWKDTGVVCGGGECGGVNTTSMLLMKLRWFDDGGTAKTEVSLWAGDDDNARGVQLDLGDGNADQPVTAPVTTLTVDAFQFDTVWFDYYSSSCDSRVDEIRIAKVGSGQTAGDAYQDLLNVDLLQATRDWANPVNGDWDTPGNWTPVGTPQTDELTRISAAGSYAVNGPDADAEVLEFVIDGQSGNTATLALAADTTLTVTTLADITANGKVNGAGTLSTTALALAGEFSGSADLVVGESGNVAAGATVNTTGTVTVGGSLASEASIQADTITVNGTLLADDVAANGVVADTVLTVNGTGSRLANIQVAQLDVTTGTTSSGLYLTGEYDSEVPGSGDNVSGDMNLYAGIVKVLETGAGDGDVTIGGNLNVTGTGHLDVRNDATVGGDVTVDSENALLDVDNALAVTGTVDIDEGTLAVGSSLSGSAVNIGDGATADGGATLNPGASLAVTGDVTFASDGTLVMSFDEVGSELVAITGSLDLSAAGNTLVLVDTRGGEPLPDLLEEYTLITVSGTLSGEFGEEEGVPEGYEVVYDSDAGTVKLIPEPATMALLALGACLPLLRRRR